MIYSGGPQTLALLADGSACRWNDSDAEVCPDIEDVGSDTISETIVCPTSGTRIIIAQNGRMYVMMLNTKEMKEITATVCEAIGKGIDEIIEICINWLVIIVRTKYSIAIIKIQTSLPSQGGGISGFSSWLHTFTSPINLISFGSGYGLIRTDDGCLYFLGRIFASQDYYDLRRIDIDYAASIHEIICGSRCIVFIMNDSSVRLHTFIDKRPQSICGSFQSIKFTEGVCIVKVIAYDKQVFYITTEGECWYGDGYTDPTRLGALRGLFVENIVSLYGHMAVLHDNGRICLLRMISVRYMYPQYGPGAIYDRVEIDPNHRDGSEKPVYLPIFDDKTIVSVIQAHYRAYFITADGGVYHSAAHMCRFIPTIEPVPFFDTNPVAIQNNAMRIRSAGNTIELCLITSSGSGPK